MKHTRSITLSTLLLFFSILFAACTTAADESWQTATYKQDASIGSGAITYALEIKAGDTSVTLTVSTDETNLGRSLLDLGIIAGEEGPYGIYVKTVNGITADYDVDQTYWAICENGKMAMTGADGITVTNGAHYEFVRTK